MAIDAVIGLESPSIARPSQPGPPQRALKEIDWTTLIKPPCLLIAVLSETPDLITTYHSLNPSTITELDCEPSPLEFMRHVSQNRPFVIRNGASQWPAREKWNVPYLKKTMGDQLVNVSMTPHGNADSILEIGDGNMLFVKPYETEEPFADVVRSIQRQELNLEPNDNPPTRYAQTQNDNLRNEYQPLFDDVPSSIPFARIALDTAPDAINFWLGNSSSVTALHKDNYENIYVQILGRKHFVLLPPVEAACVNERAVLAATYGRRPRNRDDDIIGNSEAKNDVLAASDLIPIIDDPVQHTVFATWDPDAPEINARATRLSHLSQPLRVTLEEGDMLYLPALWYHKVAQSCNDEGVCCAVNYWYDLDFGGGFWSMASFIRGVGLLSLGQHDDEDERDELGDGRGQTA